jgi:hypothetical protein
MGIKKLSAANPLTFLKQSMTWFNVLQKKFIKSIEVNPLSFGSHSDEALSIGL